MSVRLYMDVHVPLAITHGLRLRGVDVVTAQEDRADEFEDPELLDRALSLGRVLFSEDDDFLSEASRRQRHGMPFNGVIYGHQEDLSIGQCVRDLELIAKVNEPEDCVNTVIYLPL